MTDWRGPTFVVLLGALILVAVALKRRGLDRKQLVRLGLLWIAILVAAWLAARAGQRLN